MTTIPVGLPTLHRGAHDESEGRACVMEYVSVLAGEAFSDSPSCTHPLIASVARAVNDAAYDEHRHLLVPMIGRLLTANYKHLPAAERQEVDKALTTWVRKYGDTKGDLFGKFMANLPWAPAEVSVVSILSHILASTDKQVEFLGELIDEFERLTHPPVLARAVNPDALARAVVKVEGEPPKVRFHAAKQQMVKVPVLSKIVASFGPVDPVEEMKPVIDASDAFVTEGLMMKMSYSAK